MDTVQIRLEKNVAKSATAYAHQKGMDLSALIESYLVRLTKIHAQTETDEIPDVVQSLLGAGAPVDEDDLNGRKAYYSYLAQKHQ